MAEFHFDDGAYILVSADGGTVTVLQLSGGTQGRGAASMTPEQAETVALAVHTAAQEAKAQAAGPAEA